MAPHVSNHPATIVPAAIPAWLAPIRPAAQPYTAALEVANLRLVFNPSQAAANDALKIVAKGAAGGVLIYLGCLGIVEIVEAFKRPVRRAPRRSRRR